MRVAFLAILLAMVPALHAQPLRVMTFNVRLPVASDGPNRWEARRDLFADTVRKADPDIFGTQELFKLQGDDTVQRLPKFTWFGRGRTGDDSDEHMGVFYRTDRLKLLDSGNYWLSDTPEVAGSISWGHPLPRMVTWGLFKRLSDGKKFYLFDTHLPYRAQDEQARLKAVTLIMKRMQALPKDIPVILTGDFNTGPESQVHATVAAQLKDAWDTAPERSGPDKTFQNFTGKPDKRIDWIFYRGLKPLTAETVTTSRDGRYPSDHFPVLATFEL